MIDFFYIIKLLISLGIVVALIYGLYFFLNRYGRNFLQQSSDNIKIEEIKFITKNKGFILVKFEKSKFFIAFDESGFKILKEIRENED